MSSGGENWNGASLVPRSGVVTTEVVGDFRMSSREQIFRVVPDKRH